MKQIRYALLAGIVGLTPASASAFDTTAEHAVILDFESDIVLYSKDATEPMTPASMTKIMTAYVVFERLKDGRLKPDDVFTVSEKAWREGGWASGGSTMGLSIDQKVTVADLLRGMIVQSGNDACIVLAEGISGTEDAFAEEMTTLAREIGLSTASFKNATGLYAEGHEISAIDLAKLAKLSIENFPNYYKIYAETSFEWDGIRQPNRNPLLGRVDGADGLKTGHLSQSGYGLVGSASVDGNRKIIVINGLESERARSEEAQRMMRASFREFSIATPLNSGDEVAQIPVWLGQSSTVPAIVSSDVSLAFASADRNRLKAEVIINGPISAPVEQGQELGILEISGPDGVLKTETIIAGASVEKMGLFAQAFEGLANLIAPRPSSVTE